MIRIRVLGTGCKRCDRLAANVARAAEEAGVEVTIERVREVHEILAHGVFVTPALVINGELEVMGRIASAAEIAAQLRGREDG